MRYIGQVWLIVLLTALCSIGCLAADLELEAKSALLMDARSGEILFSKNITEPLPIASITKIMTLVLVLEAVDQQKLSLTDLVIASDYAASMGGSQIWLEPGEEMTLQELLYAIAVGSANDGAVAVAEFVSGSEAKFVELMNQRAQELGLSQTVYSNASGLPPSLLGMEGKQVMSAEDVAILTKHALTVPLLVDFVSTYEYTMREDSTKRPVLWNYNRLLRRYSDVNGMKTGFTTEAGYCLTATATRDNLQIVAVTLGNKSENKREEDITKILNYGFREYDSRLIAAKNSIIDELHIPKGDLEYVNVLLADDLYVTIKKGDTPEITTEIILNDNLQLPLVRNTEIGKIIASVEDRVLGEGSLIIEQDIDKSGMFQLIYRTMNNLFRVLFQGS